MPESDRKFVPMLSRVASSLSMGMAAIIFLVGGLVLSAATGISRLSGELVGVMFAFLLGWLAYELKKIADRFHIKQQSD